MSTRYHAATHHADVVISRWQRGEGGRSAKLARWPSSVPGRATSIKTTASGLSWSSWQKSSHTPEHTDAMIKGLMDSGRRMVYAYTGGINRSSDGIPHEFPGAMNESAPGAHATNS